MTPPKGYVPLFQPGHPQPTPLWCVLCGKRFRRMNGTANHGLMHERLLKGVPGTLRTDIERTGEGYRYRFYAWVNR